MTMAKLVWTFDLQPGSELIDDSVESGYSGGSLICPQMFPLNITIRSRDHEMMIQKENVESLKFLAQFRQ